MAGIVRNASGVTLIELLVVVAIMMTVLSLVGGNTLRSVNKVKGQTELISLLNIMKQASAQAFSSSTKIIVQLSGNAVSIQNPSSPRTSRTFKHLSFEKRQIVFNRNGFIGIDGIFRFNNDRIAEKELSIIQFISGKPKMLKQAKNRFQ